MVDRVDMNIHLPVHFIFLWTLTKELYILSTLKSLVLFYAVWRERRSALSGNSNTVMLKASLLSKSKGVWVIIAEL